MRAGKIFITDLDELGLLDRVRGTRPTFDMSLLTIIMRRSSPSK